MHIKILEGFAQIANLAINSIAHVLYDLFGSYTQFDTLDVVETVSKGQVVLPILAYGPKPIYLKSTAIRNTVCKARFAVYSKMPEKEEQCSRFLHKERHLTKEAFLEALPTSLREASFTFDEGENRTFIDFLSIISNIKSDRVAFFYDPEPGEGYITNCIGVIHEFGEEHNPYCVATAYFSVEIGK